MARAAMLVAAIVVVGASGCARGVRRDDGAAFEARVLREIAAVFPGDPGLFRVAHPPETAVGFYGDTLEEAAVQCRLAVTLDIVQGGRQRGSMVVARCPEHLAGLRERLRRVPDGIRAALEDEDVKDFIEEAKVLEADLTYQQTTLRDGASLHYFPLIMPVHGIHIVPTVVLLDGDRAVVVQALMTGVCDAERSPLPLCTQTRDRLSDLARRLLRE